MGMWVKFKQNFSGFKKNDVVDVAYAFADLLIYDLKVARKHPAGKPLVDGGDNNPIDEGGLSALVTARTK